MTDEVAGSRLDSWKEIAAYLRRDATTVRRWEKREGLPVHRHPHDRRDSVYAYRSEIDRWCEARRSVINGKAQESPWWTRRVSVVWSAAATLAAAMLAGIAVLVMSVGKAAPGERQLRFSILPPDGTRFGTLSLSPDGRQLAFTAAAGNGKALLWVRRLDSVASTAITGTEDAAFPFWAPDGTSIAFFASGSLKRVDVPGGTPRIICEAAGGRGGSWNAAGTIVFATRTSVLFQVSAAGGRPTPVTALDPAGERGHLWPQFLPDGRHFLYLADSARQEFHNLFVGSLDSFERKRIFRLVSDAAYARGHLLFVRDQALMAQPFDASRLELSGEPITLASQVVQPWAMDHKSEFTVSDDGTLLYRSLPGMDSEARLVWRDREGRRSPLAGGSAQYVEPTLSPDQKRVAVDIFDPRQSRPQGFGTNGVTSDIWLLDAQKGTASQFTFHPAADFDPLWSPDGSRIVFSSNRRGVLDLYHKRADGTGPEQLLFASPVAKHLQASSPDGRFIVFRTSDPQTGLDLWRLPLEGDRTPVPLLRTEFNEDQAAISPNGRWFSYTSNASGTPEVYVQDFPSGAGKWRISIGGGGDARWRPDGAEIFYIAEDRRLMAVAVTPGASFKHGQPIPLFDTGVTAQWGAGRNHYDISRDGRRFLFIEPVADHGTAPFTVVINWPAGLRQ